ncbi:MAG: NUDIX hydrolase [Clostridia bacterium]|nr:NUDIX hydrolase [Clostridia bacterium]
MEKQISREEIFKGVALHVVRDRIILPDGSESVREISLHNGAAAVIPILDDGRVIMERQFRYAHGRVMLEIPAGKLDTPDEPPLEGAKRELREETGAAADRYTYLGSIVPSPALINEVIHVYMAEGISLGESHLDSGEFLDVEYYTLDELYGMVMSGEITDAKTQIAILKAREILKNR